MLIHKVNQIQKTDNIYLKRDSHIHLEKKRKVGIKEVNIYLKRNSENFKTRQITVNKENIEVGKRKFTVV